MKTMKKLVSILFVSSIIATSAMAQKTAVLVDEKTGWQKIGETTVNFKTDKDNIVILGKDRFKALKFKVMDAAIDLQDLEVYYENEKGDMKSDNDKDSKVDVDMKGKDKGVDITTKEERKANDPNREDISVRSPIQAGQESRVIDLKGTSRELKKVVFTYRTLPNSKDEKAKVELWGLR
jgi:hypothetical protein